MSKYTVDSQAWRTHIILYDLVETDLKFKTRFEALEISNELNKAYKAGHASAELSATKSYDMGYKAGKLAARQEEEDQIWVTADGRHSSVDMLDEGHVRNILNLIIRRAREGYAWTLHKDGKLRFR
jgi:hypothetical protein